MKRLSIAALALAAVLAVVPLASAAAPYSPSTTAPKPAATVQVEGKVLTLGKGWVQVQVSKVLSGAGLRAKQKIRFREASKLTIQENGKPASLAALKAGETVEITASVLHVGKITTYRATSITIMP